MQKPVKFLHYILNFVSVLIKFIDKKDNFSQFGH